MAFDKPGSLNRVELSGRIGTKELKYTAGGTAVLNLSIATTGRKKNGENYEDVTEWHKVIAWQKLAENINEYAQKGNRIFVEGSLETRKWDDKNGITHYTTEIIAKRIDILESKKDNSSDNSEEPPTQEPQVDDPNSLLF